MGGFKNKIGNGINSGREVSNTNLVKKETKYFHSMETNLVEDANTAVKKRMQDGKRKIYTVLKAEEKTLNQNIQKTVDKGKQLAKEYTTLKEDLQKTKKDIIKRARDKLSEQDDQLPNQIAKKQIGLKEKNIATEKSEVIQVEAQNTWKENYLVQQDKRNTIQEKMRKNHEERENTYKELETLRQKGYEHDEKIELEKKNYQGWARETIYPPKSNLAE